MESDQVMDDLAAGRNVQVTAHRGSSLAAPENTLAAVRRAIADGADCIEIDVQETADGSVVLLHDSDLARIAGMRRGIWEITYHELRDIDAGSWFSPAFAQERIPTLEQVLEIARGHVGVNVELKYNGHDQRLGERVAEAVDAAGVAGDSLITSLDYAGLQRVRATRPALRVGLIVTAPVTDVRRLDVEALSMEAGAVSAHAVRTNREAGLETHVWTVDDRETMHAMMDLGVDNIITNDPLLALEVIAQRNALGDGELLRRAMARRARD